MHACVQVQRFCKQLSQLAPKLGLPLPDTIFALNTYDEPLCRKVGCQVGTP